MRFVFTKVFYLLIALGFIPLAMSWQRPWLIWLAFGYDLVVLAVAIFDSRTSTLPKGVAITREFGGRFAVGAENEVRIQIQNASNRSIKVIVKDEFPPLMILNGVREGEMNVDAQSTATLIYGLTPPRRGRFEFGHTALRFRSRLRLVWCDTKVTSPIVVKVYPNMRRAREAELKALGARSVVSSHRKTSWRGEGREFESMRDYVRGDDCDTSPGLPPRRGKLLPGSIRSNETKRFDCTRRGSFDDRPNRE